MGILEDNRKIAKYVGYEVIGQSEDYLIVREGEEQPELYYDPSTNWDNLMEAYKRIAQSRNVRIKMACGYTLLPFCSITTVDVRGITIYRENADLQTAVYQAVLEYIKKEK